MIRFQKHPMFDEWIFGRYRVQFFSVRLWQFGFKVRDGAIAFPTFAIRRFG